MAEEVPDEQLLHRLRHAEPCQCTRGRHLPEDVAAAACHSVAEQVFEQQLQEVDIREPVIMVGGTSLIQGLVKAMGDLLQVEIRGAATIPSISVRWGPHSLPQGLSRDRRWMRSSISRWSAPKRQGRNYYRRIADVVLLDHNLSGSSKKSISLSIPGIPLFIAVGSNQETPRVVRLRDLRDVNVQERKMTISIGDEAYLAPLLKILWEKYGKDRVEQPDRFTIILYLDEEGGRSIEDMPVIDPTESLYKDLIYAIQVSPRKDSKSAGSITGKGSSVCGEREHAPRKRR